MRRGSSGTCPVCGGIGGGTGVAAQVDGATFYVCSGTCAAVKKLEHRMGALEARIAAIEARLRPVPPPAPPAKR